MDSRYLRVANNLSDVASESTALANLGGLAAANNLSDVASIATTRANLGISTTIPSFPQTYTGGTTIQDVLDGAVSTVTAGMIWQFDLWGTITTTVDTQTVRWQVLFGGTAGTSLLDSGPVNPSSGSTVSAATIRLKGSVLFPSSATATAEDELDMNFYLAVVSQQAATSITAPGQLVVGLTPSAAAVSVTVNGGYWQRIS